MVDGSRFDIFLVVIQICPLRHNIAQHNDIYSNLVYIPISGEEIYQCF